MKRSRTKRSIVCFISVFAMLLQLCAPVSAGVAEGENEYEIYPTPQAVTYDNGAVALTEQVDVTYGEGIDGYTQKKTETALGKAGLSKSTAQDNAHTKLIVGIYGKSDVASYESALGAADFFTGSVDGLAAAKRFDKYILNISDNQIVILGQDTDAAFRGVTTLQRILEQVSQTDKSVRKMTVKDYAEIEFRGFIEGYYGNPWSHEDRADLLKYGGEIKMNQYVFAPKDDPYHRAQWRDLYPETGEKNSLVQIRDLAKAGNENKCYYVYALHPFYTDKITLENYDDDIADLKAKFEQVIDAGVRQIAILEDDGSAHSDWETASQILIRVLNDISAWLQEKKTSSNEFADLKTELLFCPGFMAYANSMTNSEDTDVKKIQEVHANVGENVRIVMTGGKIWGDVTTQFADRFYTKTNEKKEPGRYPYLWVNWPCSDNTHDSLVMGGHNSILKPDLDGSKYHGIIFNPMQDSEPSKVGLFTGADFCWNVWRGEDAQAQGDQAWEDSFKYIDHMSAIETESSNKLKGICQHMITQSDQQASNTGAKFEESLNIKDDLLAVQGKIEEGSELTASEISTIKTAMETIKNDIKYYITDKNGTNQRMASQLTPYAGSLSDIAEAGVNLIQAVEAIQSGNENVVYEYFAKAQELYDRSKTYMFLELGNPQYAKGGRRYIIPFVEAALEYVSEEAKKIVDPEHIKLEKKILLQVGGVKVKLSDADTATVTDGDLSTNIIRQTNQKTGDYVGMSFNIPVTVRNFKLYLSREANPNDFIAEGVLEYTVDGKTWEEFSNQPSSLTRDLSFELEEPMELRGFRVRCTEAIPSGAEAINRWLAIREIAYNMDGEFGETTGPVREKYPATLSRMEDWGIEGGEESNLTDNDPNSQVWYNPTRPNADKDTTFKGDYLQLDLGEVKPVGWVRAIVGGVKNGSASATDKWKEYHFEYSETGEEGSWTALPTHTDNEAGPHTYEVNLKGVSARYIRLVNDKTENVWIIFCDFSVYKYVYEPDGIAMDYTNVEDPDAEWRVEYEDESAKIYPREDVTLQPDEYIGLKLDRIHAISDIESSGTGMDSLTLEKSVNEIEWNSALNGNARYIRLINKTNAAVTFDLSAFNVTTDEVQPIHFVSAKEIEGYADQDARTQGTTGNWFDGNKNTIARYCFVGQQGDSIVYDLGQEVNLRSVKAWVANNAVNYPRNAEIQAALTSDSENWTTLASVSGDGSNAASNTAPVNNGWTAGEGAIDVNYAYFSGELDQPVKARFIRLYFTGPNAGRYAELSELEINNNEYLPMVNDPTFELTGDVVLQRGMEPQNLTDGNLTSAFRPDGQSSGTLIYNLSDGTANVKQINILQSGNNICNAKVSVRTGEDTWEEVGSLDKVFSSFDVLGKEHIYAVKLEWEQKELALYEIIVLHKFPETYTVEFNSNGGTEVESQKVQEGSKVTKPTDPTRSNYTFAGWYSDAALEDAFDFENDTITANTTLYAKWEKDTSGDVTFYTVTFNCKGGSEVAAQEVVSGEKALKPDDPIREGMNFAGWHTDEECTAPYDFDEAVTQNITLYAKWRALEKYTVTYHYMDGESEDTTEEVIEGEKVTRPEDPARENYIFKGWYTDAGYETVFNFNKEIVDKDIDLFAKWEPDANSGVTFRTVTFNSMEGSGVASQAVVDGAKAVKPKDPERVGYTFDGWHTDEECATPYDFDEAVTQDITLYAKWLALKKYTVTYHYMDNGSEDTTEEVFEGGKVTRPEDPTRENYIFKGWYTDADYVTKFDFNKEIVDKDIELFAKWEPDANSGATFYTVTFNSMEGSGVASQVVIDGAKAVKPKDPEREGYTFGGWHTEKECKNLYDFNEEVNEDITLYAKWTSNEEENNGPFKVTFNSNQGSAVALQTVQKNGKATEPKAPTRTGYRFAGWYDNSGKKFAFATTKITQDVTLTAKWIRVFTVTFESNGGTKFSPQTVDSGTKIKNVTPTKANYTFEGWYTDAACTKKFSPATAITKDLKLYAKWKPKQSQQPKLPSNGSKITEGDFIYKVTNSHATQGTVSVAGVAKTKKLTLKVPSTVEIEGVAFKVTAIDSKAFTKAKKLKTVEIGANITKINSKAFYKLKKLKTVKFKTLKTPKFGKNAFKGTNAKCKVTVPKKMSKKEFNNFKKKAKKAGFGKKVTYKKK